MSSIPRSDGSTEAFRPHDRRHPPRLADPAFIHRSLMFAWACTAGRLGESCLAGVRDDCYHPVLNLVLILQARGLA